MIEQAPIKWPLAKHYMDISVKSGLHECTNQLDEQREPGARLARPGKT